MACLRRKFGASSPWVIAHVPSLSMRRSFSASIRLNLDTVDMRGDDFNRIQAAVNKDRLMGDLHHTCQWGTGDRWGTCV